jgi:triacylglycerol esterase/lipase EstA (alpha/beta hydrolase family)
MMSRLARWLLLFQALLGIGLFYVAHWHWGIEPPWLAALLATGIVLAARALQTANNFILASYYRAPRGLQARLGVRRRARMLGREFVATMICSSWTIPFFSFAARAASPRDAAAPLPVLLVHGYGCNSGHWTSLSRVLERTGISHRALDMEPLGAPLERYIPLIERALDLLLEESGAPRAIIVGHSMGGLVGRSYLRACGSARVAGLITLGTPHHGSGLANFGPGANSRQMRWNGKAGAGTPSTWLQELAASESDALRALIVSIYSPHDNMVSPSASLQLAGAKNLGFPGIGHVDMVVHPTIQMEVLREIARISGVH